MIDIVAMERKGGRCELFFRISRKYRINKIQIFYQFECFLGTELVVKYKRVDVRIFDCDF